MIASYVDGVIAQEPAKINKIISRIILIVIPESLSNNVTVPDQIPATEDGITGGAPVGGAEVGEFVAGTKEVVIKFVIFCESKRGN